MRRPILLAALAALPASAGLALLLAYQDRARSEGERADDRSDDAALRTGERDEARRALAAAVADALTYAGQVARLDKVLRAEVERGYHADVKSNALRVEVARLRSEAAVEDELRGHDRAAIERLGKELDAAREQMAENFETFRRDYSELEGQRQAALADAAQARAAEQAAYEREAARERGHAMQLRQVEERAATLAAHVIEPERRS
jgi:hypothetical protein